MRNRASYREECDILRRHVTGSRLDHPRVSVQQVSTTLKLKSLLERDGEAVVISCEGRLEMIWLTVPVCWVEMMNMGSYGWVTNLRANQGYVELFELLLSSDTNTDSSIHCSCGLQRATLPFPDFTQSSS